MFDVGEVVTVMTVTGEYVGKLLSDDESGVSLEDPRFISVGEQGMGFAGGIAMTGVKDPKRVTLKNVVFIADTNPEVVSAYKSSVSGIIQPTKGSIVT